MITPSPTPTRKPDSTSSQSNSNQGGSRPGKKKVKIDSETKAPSAASTNEDDSDWTFDPHRSALTPSQSAMICGQTLNLNLPVVALRHSQALTHPRAMFVACQSGLLNVIRVMLDAMPTLLEATDDANRTPLGLACERGHFEVARFLCNRGADMNARDRDTNGVYFAPFHWAAAHNHIDMARYLTRKGASTTIRSNAHQTPLHIAALAGSTAFLQVMLLNSRSDLRSKDKDGRTPLICAAMRGHLSATQVLGNTGFSRIGLAAIGDMDNKDVGGNTALHRACMLVNEAAATKVAIWLIQKVGPGDRALRVIDSRNCRGRTPMCEAAASGHWRIVKALVRRGCDTDASGNDGEHPFSLLWSRDPTLALNLRSEIDLRNRRPERPLKKNQPPPVPEELKRDTDKLMKQLRGNNYKSDFTDMDSTSAVLPPPTSIS